MSNKSLFRILDQFKVEGRHLQLELVARVEFVKVKLRLSK